MDIFILVTAFFEQGIMHMDSVGSDDDVSNLWLVGPVAGAGFYFWKFRKYRNTDKRYVFEKETDTEVTNLRASDKKINEVRGTSSSMTRGANSQIPLSRLGQGTTVREEFHV